MTALTRKQEEIHRYLLEHGAEFERAPTLDELARALGLSSRGSLHKHVQALVEAGLVEPMDGRQRGVRLRQREHGAAVRRLPLLGRIAAGRPIEAVADPEEVEVPAALAGRGDCYVLAVRGDSMIEDGILDGDWVVVEHRSHARNGEIVVALVDGSEATLKRIEQKPGAVVLHPANAAMEPMRFAPERVQVQGVVTGLVRRYR